MANARSEGLVLATTTKELITPEEPKVETPILTAVVEEQVVIVTSTNYQFNVKRMWFRDHSTL